MGLLEEECQRKFLLHSRLRTLLSMEEEYYARMLYEQEQRISTEEFRRNFENLEKMENDREMERQKFVEMKRRQQHL